MSLKCNDRRETAGLFAIVSLTIPAKSRCDAHRSLFRCPVEPAAATDLATLRSAGQILLLIGDPERVSALAQALEPDFHVTRPGPGFWTLARSDRALIARRAIEP